MKIKKINRQKDASIEKKDLWKPREKTYSAWKK